MNSTMQKLSVTFIAATSALCSTCSTISSVQYMEPESDALTVVETHWGPQARFDHPLFSLQMGPVAMGTYGVTIGPCLVPFWPDNHESPAPLQFELHIETRAPLRIYPGRWSVTARAEEFGANFGGDDEFSRYSLYQMAIYRKPTEPFEREEIASWTTEDSPDTALRIEEPVVGGLSFPVRDNEFVDFVLEPIEVVVNGELVTIPAIPWSRHGDWNYEAFTLEPMWPH